MYVISYTYKEYNYCFIKECVELYEYIHTYVCIYVNTYTYVLPLLRQNSMYTTMMIIITMITAATIPPTAPPTMAPVLLLLLPPPPPPPLLPVHKSN